ncbi:hypothetical protein ACCT20_03450 [Rhizobium ruizarguesonis]|uniref:hypothetical protein n=1 Tax=Rhizobium TaxID=379 RepID=UPI00102FFB8C|nr:hypothetical protein [Rhizobium ruizarguesonis]TBA37481.1 hypothetical protein ELH60_08505 [Rhizobium ruizarguesonis]TBC62828.1 hypothetical protein ELH36_08515 [Rhizobium ruizarguesonis]TBD37471.1 hypothetical protein ELH18_08340 [Rhizobium ruizarguesonis]
MSHYDAIFKHLMNDSRSRFVPLLSGRQRLSSLPTHAGWYTGRAVDYFAKVGSKEYVHIEVQTRVDLTMKWRMANYFSLLHHRLHQWSNDDFVVHQYLIYLGSDESSMKSDHPKFGAPYSFEVLNLHKMKTSITLANSGYFGDRIIALLLSEQSEESWRSVFDGICNLRDEAEKMEGLFYLLEIANLRKKTDMIQQALSDMGLYDALAETPLTARATAFAAIGTHIQMIEEFLAEKGDPDLSIDERDMLLNLPVENVKEVVKAITWRGERRSAIAAESFAFHSPAPNEQDSDEFGP